MTTAIATGQVTEAEIREAIERQLGGAPLLLADRVYDVVSPINQSQYARVRAGWDGNFTPSPDHPGTLWADLRPSEVDELLTAVDAAVTAVEAAATRMLVDAVVEAAAAFARAHPDVPRGYWPNGVPRAD